DRQARQHLQFEMLEIGAQRQTQCGDQSEQHYAPADLGLTECQGDQDRGEGTQGLDADQVAQDQDHQYPDRDHDHHLVDLLGLQRQAVQGVFEQRRGAGLGGHLGQAQGIPDNRLVWWTGNLPLLQLEGGRAGTVSFTINNSEMNALRLAKMTTEASPSALLEYSLYGLPLQAQQVYQVMIMIPIGVLVILVLRNLIGIQTLGTFTPVLIALAFRETQVGWGIVLFTLITALGLSLRSYLEHLKLQMLPR